MALAASSGKPSASIRDTQPYHKCTGVGKFLTGTDHAGAWLHAAQPAQAIRDVQLPDGSTVSAYELDIALKVVALRGSVPSDANLEFRRALSKYGQFQLAQKAQIADIFDELSQPRSPSWTSHLVACLQTTTRCVTCEMKTKTSRLDVVTARVCSKKNSAARADAVVLGDAWLAPAIRAGLIQPIPKPESSRWWVRLSIHTHQDTPLTKQITTA